MCDLSSLLLVPFERHKGMRVAWKTGGVLEDVETKFREYDLFEAFQKIPQFKQFIEAPELKFSGVTIHAILLRQIASNTDEELHFLIGNTKCRFGMMEFALITGLYFNDPPTPANLEGELKKKYFPGKKTVLFEELYKAFMDCTVKEDVYKLGLCYFVHGYLFASERNMLFPLDLLGFADHIDSFINYPFGQRCFQRTLSSFKEADVSRRYSVYGFATALQYWAYETIFDYGIKFGKKVIEHEKYPRLLRWGCSKVYKLNDVDKYFSTNPAVLAFLSPKESEREFIKTMKFSFRTVSQYRLDESQILGGVAAHQAAKEAAYRAAKEAADLSRIACERGIFSTVQDAPSVVHDAPSVVHDAPSVLHDAPSVLHDAPSVVHDAPSVVHEREENTVGHDAPSDIDEREENTDDGSKDQQHGYMGGLDAQTWEIKEPVELSLTHPELYEDYEDIWEPGTGRTLLAKVGAHTTLATIDEEVELEDGKNSSSATIDEVVVPDEQHGADTIQSVGAHTTLATIDEEVELEDGKNSSSATIDEVVVPDEQHNADTIQSGIMEKEKRQKRATKKPTREPYNLRKRGHSPCRSVEHATQEQVAPATQEQDFVRTPPTVKPPTSGKHVKWALTESQSLKERKRTRQDLAEHMT